MTDDTILIGYSTTSKSDAFMASLGLPVSIGNVQVQAEAMRDYINAHGGMAGRQVELVPYDLNPSTSMELNGQQACTTWAQDTRVFAVVNIVAYRDNFYACLAANDIPVIDMGANKDDRSFAQLSGYLFNPVGMSIDNMWRSTVQALGNAHWFGDDPVIGFYRDEEANTSRAYEQTLLPELAARGHTIAEDFSTPCGSAAENASAAVLRMRAAGVTHMLYDFCTVLYFMTAAEAQGYRPLHGLHSRLSPAALLQPSLPPEQLRGSMGAGWQPKADVDARRDPGGSDTETLCTELMVRAGENMQSSRATALIALWMCDGFLVLDTALEHAAEVSTTGLARSIDALATTYVPAATFVTTLGPGRHDGASAYRTFAFLNDCNCYGYVSELTAAPRRRAEDAAP